MKTGTKNHDLFCFLTEQICDLSTRSRTYRSDGAIEPAATKSELPELLLADKPEGKGKDSYWTANPARLLPPPCSGSHTIHARQRCLPGHGKSPA